MRRTASIQLISGALLIASATVSCSTIEKARPRPKTSSVTKVEEGSTKNIMRGTVGAETIMLGYSEVNSPAHQPIVVRGYGLVVGLKGTGSRDMAPSVRAHMIEYMEHLGIGQVNYNAGDISPEHMLDSPNTAVVIVEGIIPPASVGRLSPPSVSGRRPLTVPGTSFDLRVHVDPQTGTTSLEGGRLYTADLRPGPVLTGSRQPGILAEGKGPIFINPFVAPGTSQDNSINKLSGRILNGGEVTENIPLKILLLNPSHTRVRLVQDAINRRFPQEPGQRDPTARGKSDAVIELTVPPSMRNETTSFVELVKHTTLRQANAESIALSIRRMLLADTNNASQAYWRWCAIGERSLPMIRELYDYPEDLPRLAALRSGSFLHDPIAANHLRKMAVDGSLGIRLEAADLLKGMPHDPRTDHALRQLLNDEDVEVRLRAYEALAERQDPLMQRTWVEDKFILDMVDSDHPMIYISQSKTPRIAVFGRDLEINRPLTMGAWENRLIIQDSQNDDEELEIYYRPHGSTNARIVETDANAYEFLEFLARTTTAEDPRPGLDLNYSETVGAIHALWAQGYLEADFKAEQDRLMAAIRRYGALEDTEERPEFDEPEDDRAPLDLGEPGYRSPATITPILKGSNQSPASPETPSKGANSR